MTKKTFEQRMIREAAKEKAEREAEEHQRMNVLLEAFRL